MDERISRDGEEGAGPSCKLQASSFKQEEIQASSYKLQASSTKLVKKIPARFKPQATSFKLQAPAGKFRDA